MPNCPDCMTRVKKVGDKCLKCKERIFPVPQSSSPSLDEREAIAQAAYESWRAAFGQYRETHLWATVLPETREYWLRVADAILAAGFHRTKPPCDGYVEVGGEVVCRGRVIADSLPGPPEPQHPQPEPAPREEQVCPDCGMLGGIHIIPCGRNRRNEREAWYQRVGRNLVADNDLSRETLVRAAFDDGALYRKPEPEKLQTDHAALIAEIREQVPRNGEPWNVLTHRAADALEGKPHAS